ncbi:MAG: hypothetical protein AB1405_15945 [Bdellovibrionota bacterium]
MPKSPPEIIGLFEQFISHYGGVGQGWFIGVAESAERTLAEKHGVDMEQGVWVYARAESPEAARQVLEHFAEVVGLPAFEPEEESEETRSVYVFRKS